jgi:hypothetical protein
MRKTLMMVCGNKVAKKKKLTVGIAEAMVATAAALVPARVASADMHGSIISQYCTFLKTGFVSLSSKTHTQANCMCGEVLHTSRAALGHGKLLVQGCTANSGHLRSCSS